MDPVSTNLKTVDGAFGRGRGLSKVVNKSDQQKSAEAEVAGFRANLGPFVVAAETTRMAMVFMDAWEPGKPIIFANGAFLHLTGYAREEVLGQSFNFLLADGTDTAALALVRGEFEERSATHTEGHSDDSAEILYRRKDGSTFWATLSISPVRDEDGDIVQHFASFVDLTSHKEKQAQLRMLIGELNHRVKNTLATVQSIVWQAARSSPDVEAMRRAVEARLFALSRSHDLLTREEWHSAGLFDVIQNALEPFGALDGQSHRVEITGENIRFEPKAALALGIAFNELATNAVKYGAFSNEAGSVRIEWAVEPSPDGRRLLLIWAEKDGPVVESPTHRGFGSNVIERGLAYELNGKVQLDYRPGGVVCTMNIPAPVSDHE